MDDQVLKALIASGYSGRRDLTFSVEERFSNKDLTDFIFRASPRVLSVELLSDLRPPSQGVLDGWKQLTFRIEYAGKFDHEKPHEQVVRLLSMLGRGGQKQEIP